MQVKSTCGRCWLCCLFHCACISALLAPGLFIRSLLEGFFFRSLLEGLFIIAYAGSARITCSLNKVVPSGQMYSLNPVTGLQFLVSSGLPLPTCLKAVSANAQRMGSELDLAVKVLGNSGFGFSGGWSGCSPSHPSASFFAPSASDGKYSVSAT